MLKKRIFLDNSYYPMWYLVESVTAQTFSFKVVPQTSPLMFLMHTTQRTRLLYQKVFQLWI